MLSGIMWDFDITGLLEDDDHITIFTSGNSADTETQFDEALTKLKKEMLIESYELKKKYSKIKTGMNFGRRAGK